MITASDIKVYGNIPVKYVTDMEMEIKAGQHGRLSLRAYLSNGEVAVPPKGSSIQIAVKDESRREETLFGGVIQEAYIFHENKTSQIILTALTKSVEMDKQEYSCSFQDDSDSYMRIIQDTVLKSGGRASCKVASTKTGKPVVQYKETNWEFCRRMASEMGWCVYPRATEFMLDVGLVEKRKAVFAEEKYHCCVDNKYYKLCSQDTVERAEFLYYCVESDNNYDIGDCAKYQGQKRYIFEKRAELKDGILMFTYKLGGKRRFMSRALLNRKISGVSLSGQVEKTQDETVYIKLDVDGENGKAVYPYPWLPAVGGLMYCMPQRGTKVYLYFPDHDEKNAYAVHSTYQGEKHPEFSNTQNRGLTTEYGKRLQLYEDRICFIGGMGQEFTMGRKECLIKAGRGKLVLTGQKGIKLLAPEVWIKTPQEINQYKSEGYATIKGGEIYPQGSRNPATGGNAGFSMQYEFNALAGQGILAGTETELYNAFKDEPKYEKDDPMWLKILGGIGIALLIGVVVGALVCATVASGGLAAVGIGAAMATQCGVIAGAFTAGAGVLAVGGRWYQDEKNGTASSYWDYFGDAALSSAIVGGSFLACAWAPYAAEMVTYFLLPGGLPIPLLGHVITFESVMLWASRGLGLAALTNLFFKNVDAGLHFWGVKKWGYQTGFEGYDFVDQQATGVAALILFLAAMNPRLYGDLARGFRGGNNITNAGQAASGQNPVVDDEMGENEAPFLPEEYYNGSSSSRPPLIRDSNGNVKLYRAVSEAEYEAIKASGEFDTIPGAMSDKWFATTVEDACTWGEKMDFGGSYRIIEITVPESLLDDLYYGGANLDGIGPAFCAPLELINKFKETIDFIQ